MFLKLQLIVEKLLIWLTADQVLRLDSLHRQLATEGLVVNMASFPSLPATIWLLLLTWLVLQLLKQGVGALLKLVACFTQAVLDTLEKAMNALFERIV